MIVADTSGLLALFNAKEPSHLEVVNALAGTDDVLAVSPYVVAELDYLVATRIGVTAELAVLRELAGAGYELASIDAGLLEAAADIVERFADLNIGVTDASIVALAKRYRTDRVLTLDHRHFDVLRTVEGAPFTVLP